MAKEGFVSLQHVQQQSQQVEAVASLLLHRWCYGDTVDDINPAWSIIRNIPQFP